MFHESAVLVYNRVLRWGTRAPALDVQIVNIYFIVHCVSWEIQLRVFQCCAIDCSKRVKTPTQSTLLAFVCDSWSLKVSRKCSTVLDYQTSDVLRQFNTDCLAMFMAALVPPSSDVVDKVCLRQFNTECLEMFMAALVPPHQTLLNTCFPPCPPRLSTSLSGLSSGVGVWGSDSTEMALSRPALEGAGPVLEGIRGAASL